ncbi:MAG: hypothetical protein AABN95_24015, partial [Acidobacteriota bacterium]
PTTGYFLPALQADCRKPLQRCISDSVEDESTKLRGGTHPLPRGGTDFMGPHQDLTNQNVTRAAN